MGERFCKKSLEKAYFLRKEVKQIYQVLGFVLYLNGVGGPISDLPFNSLLMWFILINMLNVFSILFLVIEVSVFQIAYS